jgi:hypothetical protein
LQANFLIDIDAMVFGMPRALFPAIGLVSFTAAPGWSDCCMPPRVWGRWSARC